MLVLVVELFGQQLLLQHHMGLHLIVRGRIGLNGVAVVHGPPVMILEPVASPEVVHVDNPRSDFTAFGIKGVDLHVKFTLLGGILGGVSDLIGTLNSANARIFDLLGGLHWKYSTLQF